MLQLYEALLVDFDIFFSAIAETNPSNRAGPQRTKKLSLKKFKAEKKTQSSHPSALELEKSLLNLHIFVCQNNIVFNHNYIS